MTTLEIKRLDSVSSTTSSFSNSQTKSPVPSYKARETRTSNASNTHINRLSSTSPLKTRIPTNSGNYSSSGAGGSDEPDFVQEIPISIIKSPSYTNNLSSNSQKINTPVLLNIETVSPARKQELDSQLLKNKKQSESSDGQKLKQISYSSISIPSTPKSFRDKPTSDLNKSCNNVESMNNKSITNSSAASSSNQLNSSDDIDYVLNINNSSNPMEKNPNETANLNTLRFNKYGFVQQQVPDRNENNRNTLNVNKTSLSSKNNSPSKENENYQAQSTSSLGSSSLANNKNISHADLNEKNRNSTSVSSNSNVAVTNLKDYLQNTDVEQFAESLPIEVIRSRETKWIEMLSNFDEWMEKRFKKIKSRCRKGIPQSMRSRAWMQLTGAFMLKQQKPTYYNDCLQNLNKVDINKYIEDIKKDLHRQFPSHEIFMKKEGRQMLFNVLKAYAVHNKEVGYCQAQGPIAALLLMHMPEEDSFWMLIRISDFYLKEYFKPGLEKVQIDGQALFYLFKKENQSAYKLMKNQGIDPILFMTEWFMCIFARTLPWCTVLRVWDMFFCEGVKVLYRVGLYLMLSAFGEKQKFQRCQQQGMYETLSALKNLPISALDEHTLVRDSSLIKIGQDDLSKAFVKSKQEFIKQTNEIQKNRKQPPPPSSFINTKKK